MTKEQKFYKALQDVFIGAKIEGKGGFVNKTGELEKKSTCSILEQVAADNDAQEWIMLRELKNLLSHEYSEEEEDIIRGINKLYEISKRLCEIYNKIKLYSESKGLL